MLPFAVPWKMIGVGLAGIAVVAAVYFAFNHYTNLLDTVTALEKNNTSLTIAVDEQKVTIAEQKTAIGEWKEAQDTLVARMDEMEEVAHDAAKERRRLDDIFSKHDFTNLARQKPGLVERIINRGTADYQRMLKCASGSRDQECTGEDRPTGPEPERPEPEGG